MSAGKTRREKTSANPVEANALLPEIEQKIKNRSTVYVFPSPPLQKPIPPGERPPTYTSEEISATQKVWAEYHRTSASLFTLEDLNEIIASLDGPPLHDTSYTQCILRGVRGGIQNRLTAAANPDVKKHRERHQARRKEWSSIRKFLATLEDSQKIQVQWFAERPWYGPEGKAYRERFLAKIEAVSSAMDNVEGYLFHAPQKAKGQHGPSALRDVELAVNIFAKLAWAWQQAGVTENVPEYKRYQITKSCMTLMGQSVDIDTLRKQIKKYIKAYPFHAEKEDGQDYIE